MSLISIKLKAGINSVQTPTLNEMSWSAGSNIRFFQGLPQKDAGFVELFASAPLGVIRALKAWLALSDIKYLGVASEAAANMLHVWDGSTLTDITPVSPGVSGVATLDNWGEFLMTCFQTGPIYVWMPPPAAPGPAAPIGGSSPADVAFIFVATQEQMLIACGATDAGTGDFDPMLIRWSDISDYTQWTPSTSDQAGSFRLAIGSQITAALAIYGQNFIWTDTCVYSMQYIQFPLVWGFQPLGINVGAVGPHSIGILGAAPFWMGPNQFFTMAEGAPVPLECPVWDQVFANIDQARINEVTCQTDTFYGEVGWSVPQTGGGWVTARLQVASSAWTCSDYHHDTAWIDQNVFGAPLGGREDGIVDQHDIGYDANGQAAPWSLTSGITMISEGSETTFLRELIPDFETEGTNPTINWTLRFYDYPNKTPRVKTGYATDQSTQVIHPRGRGRGVQVMLSGDDLGTFWRLGNVRVRAQQDGKR